MTCRLICGCGRCQLFDSQDHRFGEVASRRRSGLTVARMSWRVYRWTMIQFAKFVLVEFGYAPRTDEVEEVVDAWLAGRPPL